jgi:hypothetical protein
MTYPQGTPLPRPRPRARLCELPDPLDDALVGYWDGRRWTFHTAVRRTVVPVEARPRDQAPPAVPALRPDVAQALERVRGALVGSMKEVNLLGGYLGPEERVLALTSAQGEGLGVLACTNQRLLFLFVGLVRKQLLQVNGNQAKVSSTPRSRRNGPHLRWPCELATSPTCKQWPRRRRPRPPHRDWTSSEGSSTGLPAQPRGTGPQGVLQSPLTDSSGSLRQHPRMDSGRRGCSSVTLSPARGGESSWSVYRSAPNTAIVLSRSTRRWRSRLPAR